jgi:hypothetical protein
LIRTAKSGGATKIQFSDQHDNQLTFPCLSPQDIPGYAWRVSLVWSPPKLRDALRKSAAIAALLALLLPGVSALAGALSAADLPACCNTIYCPLHHRQMSDVQKDKSNCDAMGEHTECSMRACDASSKPIVGTVALDLVAPIALRGPAVAEAAPALASQFFPSVATIPLTPPPRTFLS